MLEIKLTDLAMAMDEGKRIVLVQRDNMQLGLELDQVGDDVLLLLQLASLTVRMVGVDQAGCPGQRNPPLVFPRRAFLPL